MGQYTLNKLIFFIFRSDFTQSSLGGFFDLNCFLLLSLEKRQTAPFKAGIGSEKDLEYLAQDTCRKRQRQLSHQFTLGCQASFCGHIEGLSIQTTNVDEYF